MVYFVIPALFIALVASQQSNSTVVASVSTTIAVNGTSTNASVISTTPTPTAVPILSSISPSSGPSQGVLVNLFGSNYPEKTNIRIVIGATACQSPSYVSASALQCTVSPGVGALLPVSLSLVNVAQSLNISLSNASVTFSYLGPSLSAVTPSIIPTGNTSSAAVLTGSSFGGGLADFTVSFGSSNYTLPANQSQLNSTVGISSLTHTTASLSVPGYSTATNVSVSVVVNGMRSERRTLYYVASSPPISLTIPGTVATFNRTAFQLQILRAISLDSPDQVFITSIVPGSVIVTFVLLPNPVAAPGSSNANLDSVIQSLKDAAANGALSTATGATGTVKIGTTEFVIQTPPPLTLQLVVLGVPLWIIAPIVGGALLIIIIVVVIVVRKRKSRKTHPNTNNQGQ